jgi:hypothetical protein
MAERGAVRGTSLIIRTGCEDLGVRKLRCAEKFSFPLVENTLSHQNKHVHVFQVHSQDNKTTCISTLYRQNSEPEKR